MLIIKSNQSGQPITAWSEREKEELDKFDIPYRYCNLRKEVKTLIEKDKRLKAKHSEMPVLEICKINSGR